MVTSFQVGLPFDRTELDPASVAPNARPWERVFRFRAQRRFGQRYGRNWAITTLDRPADDRLFWFAWNCEGRLCRASEDRDGYLLSGWISLLAGLNTVRLLLRRTPDRVNVFSAFGPKGGKH